MTRILAALTIAGVAVAALAPVSAARIVGCYALAVAAAVCAGSAWRMRSAEPPRGRGPARGARDDGPPPQLREVERALTVATHSAYELDRSLQPILRAVARSRLARLGVDLDGDAEAVRRALGEELAALVRSDRAVADDRLAPGWTEARVGGCVDRLEAL